MRSFITCTLEQLKSTTRWVGHAARIVEMRNAYKILVRKLKGRHHSEDLGVDGTIGK
jgi:hypothetical protein